MQWAMPFSIMTCICRPNTCMFLLGLMESCWIAGRFSDLLFTPGRIILIALLIRSFFKPGLKTTINLFIKTDTWLKLGLAFLVGSTLIVSIFNLEYLYFYGVIMNFLSVFIFLALLVTIKNIKEALMAFFLGLNIVNIYFLLVLFNILNPIMRYSGNSKFGVFSAFAIGRMNPNASAITIALTVFCAFALLRLYNSKKINCGLIFFILIGMINIIFTGSRSGLLSLFLGLGILLIFYQKKFFYYKWIILIVIPILLMSILISLKTITHTQINFIPTTRYTYNRFITEVDADSQNSSRKHLWLGAIQTLTNHPFFPSYSAYRDEYRLMSHNTFLEVALQGGGFAAVGFIIILLGTLITIYKFYKASLADVGFVILLLLILRAFAMFFTAMPGDKIFFLLVAFTALLSKYNLRMHSQGHNKLQYDVI